MVKNPPANAGDMNSIPGRGKSHLPQLLKHTCLEPVLQKREHHNEKPVHHNEEQHPEKARVQQRRPSAATKTQCSQKEHSLGISSLQILALLFLVLCNKSLQGCLYSVSLTVTSQRSPEPTPTVLWPNMTTWQLLFSRSA